MNRSEAISNVFIPLVRNIVNNPLELKYRTIREENAMVAKAFSALAVPYLTRANTEEAIVTFDNGEEAGKMFTTATTTGETRCERNHISLDTCSASDLLFACGFRRGTQVNAKSGLEEAVWTLGTGGEQTQRLGDFLEILQRYSSKTAANGGHISGPTSAAPSQNETTSLRAVTTPVSSNSSALLGGVAADSSASSTATLNHQKQRADIEISNAKEEEIDLNQIKRLKELRAARLEQQKLQHVEAASSNGNGGGKQEKNVSSLAMTEGSTTAAAGPSSSTTRLISDEEIDFLAVQHLVDKVKLTIHKTGRLRNYSFEARDFTLRRMTHGRMAHLCADDRCLQRGKWLFTEEEKAADEVRAREEQAAFSALAEEEGKRDEGAWGKKGGGPLTSSSSPPVSSFLISNSTPIPAEVEGEEERGHCLEAHWHVRNANIIYSYVAHLSPSGSRVLHMGEEFGYQYNSLPGTAHFGKTVLLTVKKVNMETNRLESVKHPNKPAEKCAVCGIPFSKLWL